MIRFERVSKVYEETHAEALKEISFRVRRGEFVLLTGESGSGKTTLLKLLLREFLPEQGRILVDGRSLQEMGRKQIPYYRRTIGMMWQDCRLIEDRSAYENVFLARQAAGSGKTDAQRQVCSVLAMLGLEDLFRRYPSELSGGEKQKVCLARALVNHPCILLADEPTGQLDPGSSEELTGLLAQINQRGVTVLMAAHDAYRAVPYAHRVIRLEKGRIKEEGSVYAKEERRKVQSEQK